MLGLPVVSWCFSNCHIQLQLSHCASDFILRCFSRQAGHRFGEHLEKIIPLIVKYAKIDGDDELREYCIQVRCFQLICESVKELNVQLCYVVCRFNCLDGYLPEISRICFDFLCCCMFV